MPRDLKRDRVLLREWFAERDAPCPRCGYSLKGLDSVHCPECGKLLHPSDFTHTHPESTHNRSLDSGAPSWLRIPRGVIVGVVFLLVWRGLGPFLDMPPWLFEFRRTWGVGIPLNAAWLGTTLLLSLAAGIQIGLRQYADASDPDTVLWIDTARRVTRGLNAWMLVVIVAGIYVEAFSF